MHFDVVSVDLHFFSDLVDHLLIAVFTRAHPNLILAVLISLKDVNDLQSH